ncbi:hypothetical protein ACFYT4_21160 [Streptomyces sp. NPDC004609]|uniref:hypothetical protein n=1 Tax=Streptomyces sp. NPDC004609 TaxID=3364704 RepID=UPI0036908752
MRTLCRRGRPAAAVLAGLALAVAASATPVTAATPVTSRAPDGWLRTGEGITAGISGTAVLAHGGDGTDVLVVHDNKRAGERRLSRILLTPGSAPRTTELRWDGDRLPVDLEALSEVPGRRGEFVALESSGHGYHLRLEDGTSARVVREFTVPGVAAGDNYEGFTLTGRTGRLVALWAHRGQDEDPALLHTAFLDWQSLSFGPRHTTAVRVPYPREDVRHISDLEVSPSGRVLVTSASDPGDDGPFDSAVHHIGRVNPYGPQVVAPILPTPYLAFPGHKIEALTCDDGVPGVLGTDDENAGGSVRTAAVCGA